nr:hypothetical protein CFP56_35109 [Quercus suber]
MVVSDANSRRVVDLEGAKNLGQPQSLENFQAVIQEIDGAIHGEHVFQNSKQVEMEPSLNFDGMVAGLKGPSCMHDITGSLVLSMEEDSCQLGEEVNMECDKLFNPGWSSKSTGKKANKVLGLGAVSKAQQLTRSPTRESMNVGNQKLGTWTRVSRPHVIVNDEGHVEKEGPKRSTSQAGMIEEIRTRVKSFHDLLWQVLMTDSSVEEDAELVVIVAWALWSNRNEVRHGGRKKSAVALFQWSRQYLQEFQEAS